MKFRLLLFLLLMLTFFSNARAEVLPLFIGTYTQDNSQGINLAHFNTETGELKDIAIAAPTANPTFLALHPNGKYLYCVNESGKTANEEIGGISAFAIDDKKNLTPLNAVAAGGGLCHLSIDATGKYLLAAAYGGGWVEVWALKTNGEIGERTQFLQHPTETDGNEKQKKPHGHQFILSPDNRFSFAVDLGLDKIFMHHFDATTGKFSPTNPAFAAIADGSGPRHLVFNSDATFAYVINELGNTITVFKHRDGALENLQTIATLPENFGGKSYTAEITIHPNGQFLYGSNRGRDSIAIYSIDAATGKLKQIGEALTEGRNPRHFSISPDGKWLLAANQSDHSIIVFRVDQASGMLTKTSLVKNIPGEPVCLLFASGSTPLPRQMM